MSPPISKDWWVAAALSSAALPAAFGQQPPAAGSAARPAAVVTTAVTGQRQARPPMYIERAQGQKLTTGPNETMHVLFSDQSAITVGPNSEVVIAEYRYDNQAKEGNLLIDLSKGLLRVVGGFISKKSETQVRTATATIGIRGGISIAESNGLETRATFLFGTQMRATSNNGITETITRPGFSVSQGNNGGFSSPQRTTQQQLSSLNSQFSSSPGGGGGGGTGGLTLPGGSGGAGGSGGVPSSDRLQNRNNPDPSHRPPLRDLLNQQTPNAS